MMVNKVILIGNVGSNPEVKTVNENTVAQFSLATSSKKGENEYTEWHKIVIWGKLAEVVQKYVTKGMRLYLEGSLRTRSWEDESGNKKYATEVVCFVMKMLSPKKAEEEKPREDVPWPETAPDPDLGF